MKKLFAILLSALILIGLSSVAFAETIGGEWKIYESDDHIIMWSLDTESGTIVLSANNGELGGWSSNEPWKEYKDIIKKIIVKDGVKVLNVGSFDFMENATEIILPDSIDSIITEHGGNYSSAFGEMGYVGNKDNWDDGVIYINKCLIETSYNEEEQCVGTYKIRPETVCMGDFSFNNWKNMTDIIIPNTIYGISSGSLNGSGIINLVIPEGVRVIEFDAVSGCPNLKSVYIPASIERISPYCLTDNPSLTDVYYASSENDWKNLLVSKDDYSNYSDFLNGVTVHFNVPEPRNDISVIVDGEKVKFDQLPIIENGRTLVPVRTVLEAIGATVDWDDTTQTVFLTKNATTIKMPIAKNEFYKNGVAVPLDAPAKILNGRTVVPIRAIVESFGYKVDWDDQTKTITITVNS